MGWVPFGEAGHLGAQIFHAPGAKLWHYATELHILSQLHILCVVQLLLTPSQVICLRCTKVNLHASSCFVPLIIQNLTRATHSPNGFKSCHDWGSNLLPTDEITLTTQPIRPAKAVFTSQYINLRMT